MLKYLTVGTKISAKQSNMSAKELLALRKKEKQEREAREREERERSERGTAGSDEDEGEKRATAVAAVAETMRSPAVMEVSSSLKHEKAGDSRSLSRASSSASRYSVYLLYCYKSANTDTRVCACI